MASQDVSRDNMLDSDVSTSNSEATFTDDEGRIRHTVEFYTTFVASLVKFRHLCTC